jgi:hypothetical protein
MGEHANFAPREKVDSRKPRALDFERATFMWDLWTGLYMLEPWEKMLFSACRRGGAVLLPALAPLCPLSPYAHTAPSSCADGFLVVLFSSLLYYFLV